MPEASPTASKSLIGATGLAWLLVGGLFAAWFYSIGLVIGAGYHPYAPFSPFGFQLFVLAAIGFALSLPFAAWVTWAARRPGFRAWHAFAVFGVTLLALLVGRLAIVEPLPSHTTLYIGETAYRVPTGYRVNEGGTQPGDDGFAIEFCREDLSSRYDERHRGCETTVVGLSKSDKLGFDAAAALLRPGAGRITLDGWTVIVPEGFDPATGQTAGSGD